MSEQEPFTPSDSTTETKSSQSQQANSPLNEDLLNEVRELGHQIEAAFRAAIESDHSRQLQQDLMGGLKELTSQVKTAVRSVQDNPKVQQASERGLEALRNAQQSKTAQDLQETLVSGISQLNVQLRKLVDRLESGDFGTSTPTQHVPVERDYEVPNTSTGPTTKLDTDGTTNEDPRD